MTAKYMTQTPPSRYQYRSDAEFNTAMDEWCRDFEPRYFVTFKKDGKYIRQEFESREAAIEFIGMDSSNKFLSSRVADKFIECPVLYRPEVPDGDGKQMRYNGDLPGGSRSDYRAAGYRII